MASSRLVEYVQLEPVFVVVLMRIASETEQLGYAPVADLSSD